MLGWLLDLLALPPFLLYSICGDFWIAYRADKNISETNTYISGTESERDAMSIGCFYRFTFLVSISHSKCLYTYTHFIISKSKATLKAIFGIFEI